MRLVRMNRPDFWVLSPFEQLTGLGEEMNRLFGAPAAEATSSEFFNGWAPALDLSEDSDNLVVTVELPGMKKEDIQVTVHEGVLIVAGERKRERSVNAAQAYRTERFHGRFHRTISLPKPVKIASIKAAYKNGILTISMPKTEDSKPKQIEVNVG